MDLAMPLAVVTPTLDANRKIYIASAFGDDD